MATSNSVQIRKRGPRKDVHTEHCCRLHGCKYGDDDCTVVTGKRAQSLPCETCQWQIDEDADEIDELVSPYLRRINILRTALERAERYVTLLNGDHPHPTLIQIAAIARTAINNAAQVANTSAQHGPDSKDATDTSETEGPRK